jgi:hypothetical protein
MKTIKITQEMCEKALKDDLLRAQARKHLEDYQQRRKEAFDRAKGFLGKDGNQPQLRRSAYDYLKEQKLLTTDALIESFSLILRKVSPLPSSVRCFVADLMAPAMTSVLKARNYYQPKI